MQRFISVFKVTEMNPPKKNRVKEDTQGFSLGRFVIMKFNFVIPVLLSLLIVGCGQISGSKASLQITSDPQSKVLINGTEFGQTPFFSDQLSANQTYQVKIQSNSGSYTQELKLLPNTLSIINHQHSLDEQKSQGETISLVKGSNGLKVLSFPNSAQVFVDGKFEGIAPLNIDNLQLGDHRVTVRKEGFVERSVRVHTRIDYSVVVNSQLAIKDKPLVKALKKVLIKDSPTGFLRVRSGPDINSEETDQVSPGQIFEVLDVNSNFVQIKIDELTSGWISSEYAQNL